MFTLDATLDAVEKSQLMAVKTFVRNEVIADAMAKFVETQTEFTRQAMKAGTDMANAVSTEMIKSAGEMAKMDTARFFENANKVWTDMAKTFAKTGK